MRTSISHARCHGARAPCFFFVFVFPFVCFCFLKSDTCAILAQGMVLGGAGGVGGRRTCCRKGRAGAFKWGRHMDLMSASPLKLLKASTITIHTPYYWRTHGLVELGLRCEEDDPFVGPRAACSPAGAGGGGQGAPAANPIPCLEVRRQDVEQARGERRYGEKEHERCTKDRKNRYIHT